ncbi:MAG: PA0069 family radical SAM protein [Pseudomonadales bacterium]|nr:PA0069 family radical SAM protein [Pseudomonadales bacterium]
MDEWDWTAPNKVTPQKGRGASSNPDSRFADRSITTFQDGWDSQDDQPNKLKTEVLKETSRTIISTNNSPDIPFQSSINPYKGCEHGCIYCYARPTHAYWDLSPGLDFETKIIVKENAVALLKDTLSKPGYKVSPIVIGANTDPYQPLEATLKITRSLIKVLSGFNHPFSIISKSGMMTRDLDLLAPMAEKRLFSAAISVTTLDNDLKRKLEPRAASGQVRLDTIRTLTEAGIPVSLMVAPIIPSINDNELERILVAGHDAGAVSATYILLRLPLEVSDMFREWLAVHFPDRADKVMGIVQNTRGGQDYQSQFGERMRGSGAFADLLQQRFDVACRRLGFKRGEHTSLDSSLFKRVNQQLTLF